MEGMRTIRQRVFVGMPALYAWLNIVLAALPNTMLGVDTEGRSINESVMTYNELQQPRRIKLSDPSMQ